jgi:hypothetical protein
MKKGDKVSRLKERKRIREKRQRWRRREEKRMKKMMTPAAMVAEAEEKMGEITQELGRIATGENILPPLAAGEEILRFAQNDRRGLWMRIKNGFLKLRYPPSYVGDVVVVETWWLKWLRKIFAVGRRGG